MDNKKTRKRFNVAINFKALLKCMKRFVLIWLIAAIVVGILDSVKILVTSSSKGSVSAVVNFSFDGIEQGLDPSGNKFDVYEMKDESIVKSSLEELGLDSSDEMVSEIRNNISIDGVVPGDIINEITSYSSIISSNSVNSLNVIKDTSYNPTQFTVTFRYTNADVSRKNSALILNKILENYETYFYDIYGYNSSIGDLLVNLDYSDYDYSQAIELIDSYLNSLQQYIDSLSESDNTRFISSQTNLSFSDLSEAIDTLRSEDIEWISSYIISNNVTKDKTDLVNYYKYKIDNSNRLKTYYQEQLDTVNSTIEMYQKTSTVVLGVGNDSQEYQYSQPSDKYDELVQKKVTLQTYISKTDEDISEYKQRMSKLNSANNNSVYADTTEQYISNAMEKINDLISKTSITAKEYFETADLLNAYQIVSQANSSPISYISKIIASSHEIISYEFVLLSVYILVALVFTLKEMNSGKKQSKQNKKEDNKLNG
jgi:hypothetical protein